MSKKFKNKIFLCAVYLFSLIAVLPLFFIFGFIFTKGISALSLDFFLNIPKPVGEIGGGVANAIVGSVMVLVIGLLLSLPVGILAGVCLAEFKDKRRIQILSQAMEVLNGVPSIIIGIVAYTWVVKPLGEFSGFSGGVAIGMMMIPVIARNTEETLKMLPHSLREASLALGATPTMTMIKVVLPAGISGILTGVVISSARAAGETAPLLFTAFGSPFINFNIMKPVETLPHLIYTYAVSPYEEWHQLAWGGACVLLIGVLGLNLFAKVLAKKYSHY